MSEEKYRYTVRLGPDTERMVREAMPKDNCQSLNEFTENALRFYAGYLNTKDASEYLAPVLSQVLHGTLDSFGAHINRNLFRLSVEEAKTWNVIAGMFKVSPEQLKYVHGKAVGEVRQLGDRLTYEKVYAVPYPLEYSLDLLTGENE